jgi:lipoprotein-anchoring transpeptidase ErfK/SrfK
MSPVSTPGPAGVCRRQTIIGLLTAAILLSAGAVSSAPASATQLTGTERLAPASPPTQTKAWVAKVVYPTVARSAPSVSHGRRMMVVFPVSRWGTPTQLLVLGSRVDALGRPWLRVRLDYRPNGFAAWIDAEDTILFKDPWRISVSREQRTLSVYRADRLIRSFAVVVGKQSTPTPAGLFAVASELRQPNPGEFEGSWVLPLTAHSGVLQHFEGGDGQIALHGRGGASLVDPLGTARSHGCVRMYNAAIGWIAAHVPIGTPVRVR